MRYADWDQVRRLSIRKGGRMFIIYRDGREQQVPHQDQERVRVERREYLEENTLDFLGRFR